MSSELIQEVRRLAEERGVLILAHFYQTPDVIAAAGCVGDSFELARQAVQARESTLLVCGVRFMAESAKLLSPAKTVLLPSPEAGCPMADMVTPADVASLRERYPRAAFMCYVNSSAHVKAVCDVCCTSSSAVRVARALSESEIVFLPDRNLGAYVAAQVPEKVFHLYSGYCPIHDSVTLAEAEAAKAAHPGALLLLHPECRPEVAALADVVGSTAEILRTVRRSERREFLIGTERGVADILSAENPDGQYLTVSPSLVCDDMKKVRLSQVRDCLLGMGGEAVFIDPAVIAAARKTMSRMMELAAG